MPFSGLCEREGKVIIQRAARALAHKANRIRSCPCLTLSMAPHCSQDTDAALPCGLRGPAGCEFCPISGFTSHLVPMLSPFMLLPLRDFAQTASSTRKTFPLLFLLTFSSQLKCHHLREALLDSHLLVRSPVTGAVISFQYIMRS